MIKRQQKYSSRNPSITQHQWAQDHPHTYSCDDSRKRIFCCGKPTTPRNWRESREQHRSMARYWARCITTRLHEVADDHTLFRGCIKMPSSTIDDWREFKKRFRKLVNKCEDTFAFVGKQHVVCRGGRDGRDDIHFDITGYTSIMPSRLRRVFLWWIAKAGGKRGRGGSSIVTIGKDNIETTANYTMKYAGSGEQLDRFYKTFPLPKTQLSVTWVLGKFWGKTPEDVTICKIWDGQPVTEIKRLSPQQQVWRKWVFEHLGDGTPEYTTFHYRQRQKLLKLVESLIRGKYEIVPNILTQQDTNQSKNRAVCRDGWSIRPHVVKGLDTDLYQIDIPDGWGETLPYAFTQDAINHIESKMVLSPLKANISRDDSGLQLMHWGGERHIAETVEDWGNCWSVVG